MWGHKYCRATILRISDKISIKIGAVFIPRSKFDRRPFDRLPIDRPVVKSYHLNDQPFHLPAMPIYHFTDTYHFTYLPYINIYKKVSNSLYIRILVRNKGALELFCTKRCKTQSTLVSMVKAKGHRSFFCT